MKTKRGDFTEGNEGNKGARSFFVPFVSFCSTLLLLFLLGCATAPERASGGSPLPAPRVDRSPKWPAVRAAHLREHPACFVCGNANHPDVHHINPVHLRPDLELCRTNLVTLCEFCHFQYGHLGDWHGWNPFAGQNPVEIRENLPSKKVEEK